MKLTAMLLVFLIKSPADAQISGFSLHNQLYFKACKEPHDWADDFTAIKSWPNPDGGQLAVNIRSVSDCNAVTNIVQAAIDANIKVLAGVWAFEADGHYEREKGLLNRVISEKGCDWLLGVSVGTEDLYRHDTDPHRLAAQIYDVRGMVHQDNGSCKFLPITHTDEWSAWVNTTNAPVLEAVDLVASIVFPFFDGVSVLKGKTAVEHAMQSLSAVTSKQIWGVETGWPTRGPNQGAAEASISGLQTYWREMSCPGGPLYKTNSFWHQAIDQDTTSNDVEDNFGLATSDRKLKIDLNCPSTA